MIVWLLCCVYVCVCFDYAFDCVSVVCACVVLLAALLLLLLLFRLMRVLLILCVYVNECAWACVFV